MLYQLHEMQRAFLTPFAAFTDAGSQLFSSPYSPLAYTPISRQMAAGYELMTRIGKEYQKPAWNLPTTQIGGKSARVIEAVALDQPFCRLVHYQRDVRLAGKNDPKVLLVAPLSGHHATLLHDTVRALLRDHRVYVTDWVDARMVPASEGEFGLDDYIAYIQEFIRHLGVERLHVVSVCQPTVPVLAAVSLMASRGEPTPRTLVMMGGPIDARCSPTAVNNLATQNPLSWFENNVIHTVPASYPGAGRRVYPGFLQHAGFLSMNPSRHFSSHWDFYTDLVKGDLEDADAHRRFYDEYNAVLDMPAKYYLDTIRVVFQDFLLPRGEWVVNGEKVDPSAIRDTALLSIEGELDDIAGLGQTEAAQALCTGITADRREHFIVEGAGHYGIFSGRRWREVVYPKVRDFFAAHAEAPAAKAAKKKSNVTPLRRKAG